MDDPYKILGVARDASREDIRKAYRKLAKQHHPDLNPGDAKAEAFFKDVAAANDLLSDPEKRARFDRGEIDASGQERAPGPGYRSHAEGEPGRRYRRGGPQAEEWTAEDLSDLFGGMYQGERARGAEIRMRGHNEHYSLSTAFLDAINGATRRLTLPDGRTLDVRIPPGTTEGQVLRLRGQGGPGLNGGPAGDALIAIQIIPHRFFERRGNDIRLVLPVTLAEAVAGGPVQVPTPGGPVKMTVPAHSDSGTELRLRGRGVPAHGDQPAGDLYATLRVVIGTQDAALEAFVASWKPEPAPNPRAAMEAQS